MVKRGLTLPGLVLVLLWPQGLPLQAQPADNGYALLMREVFRVSCLDCHDSAKPQSARNGAPSSVNFSLAQNSPNPFNPATTVSYQVPQGAPCRVRLAVYDLSGRLVRTLVDEERPAVAYSVFWDGTGAVRRWRAECACAG